MGKRRKSITGILSLALALVLTLGFFQPLPALAAEDSQGGADVPLSASASDAKYDPRLESAETNALTPAKNQGLTYLCASFSMIGALEAYVEKNTPGDTNPDFSERHVAYALSKYAEEPFIIHDRPLSDPNEEIGVNGLHSYLMRAEMAGPVLESDDPFAGGFTATSTPEEIASKPRAGVVTDIVVIPDYPTADAPGSEGYENWSNQVKSLVSNSGAVSINYYNSGSSEHQLITSGEYTGDYCYYSADVSFNHSVIIVGWDDNFSRENFTDPLLQPEGDGAWLIKQSWNENPEEMHSYKAFAWVSYYTYACDAYAITGYEPSVDTAIYDYTPAYHSSYNSGNQGVRTSNLVDNAAWAVNIFDTADGAESLERITFNTKNPPGTVYEVYLAAGDRGKVTDEELIRNAMNSSAVGSLTISGDGYFSVDCADFPLGNNKTFAVALKIKDTTGAGYLQYGLHDISYSNELAKTYTVTQTGSTTTISDLSSNYLLTVRAHVNGGASYTNPPRNRAAMPIMTVASPMGEDIDGSENFVFTFDETVTAVPGATISVYYYNKPYDISTGSLQLSATGFGSSSAIPPSSGQYFSYTIPEDSNIISGTGSDCRAVIPMSAFKQMPPYTASLDDFIENPANLQRDFYAYIPDNAFVDAEGLITLRTMSRFLAPYISKPVVRTISPAGNATDVAVNGTINISFDRAIDLASGSVSIDGGVTANAKWGTTPLNYQVDYSNLEYDTQYELSISGFTDPDGNVMEPVTYQFTTTLSPDAMAVKKTKERLNWDLIKGENSLQIAVTNDLVLSTTGIDDATISWSSDNSALAADGTLTRPPYGSGDATVVLTATITKNEFTDTVIFHLTLLQAPAAPTIIGPTALTLEAGYSATSTDAYTVTGNPVPTVTKESGDAAIVWNSETQKLDINAGLSEGIYPVVLKAQNGETPDAMLTFTLTVESAEYSKPFTLTLVSVGTGASGGGQYAEGDSVSINAGTPPEGMRFKEWTATLPIVFVDANNANTTFSMPANAVTVTAEFEAIPATVTSVTVNPPAVTVQKGASYQFGATVTGTNNPAQTVIWSVSGGVTETVISTDGTLTVDAAETAATLTVTAVSTADTTKSGTAIVTVSDIQQPTPTVDSVTVSPAAVTLNKGEAHSFSAVVAGTNDPPQTVTWVVEGNSDAGTSITDGVLTVGANETALTLTIRAASTLDPGKSGTATVTVTQSQEVFVPVSNIGGVPATATVGTLTLSGTVEPSGATNRTIIWSVKATGSTGATITSGNILNTAATGIVTVVATIMDGKADGEDYTKDFTIEITEISPTACTVTFNSNGGTTVADIPNVASGSTISAPMPPTKAGYTFGGWYKEVELTNAWDFAADTVTGNITLYAKWVDDALATYTVAFNSNGGTAVTDMTGVTSGNTISAPIAPTKAGYTFGGWYREATLTTAWNFATDTVIGNITLYAKWAEDAPTTYTVTFNSNGGTAVTDMTGVTSGNTISAPIAPTKAGYTFGGWYREATLTTAWNFATDTVIGNITLYAKWTEDAPTTYTVTFNSNGGTEVASIMGVTSGSIISAPTSPTKAGYTFGGWYKETTLTTAWNFATDIVTADITLHARWNSNGGGNDGGGGTSTPTNPSGSFSDGNGYIRDSASGIVFIVQKDFSFFSNVRVNNAAITRNTDYTAESGSTKITLLPVYLDILQAGTHTITVNFTDGTFATGSFTITASAETQLPTETHNPDTGAEDYPDVPQTGDNSGMGLWTILLGVSVFGIVGIALLYRRRQQKGA